MFVHVSGHRVSVDPKASIGKGGEADVFDLGGGTVLKLWKAPDHPDYAKLMGVPPKASCSASPGAPAQAAAPAYQAPAPQRAPVTGKPSWAQ